MCTKRTTKAAETHRSSVTNQTNHQSIIKVDPPVVFPGLFDGMFVD
jgi:hypothetical protein